MKHSPKDRSSSTFPLIIIDTLVSSKEKEKLTKLLCSIKTRDSRKNRMPPVPKKLDLYPVHTTVTVHHQRYRENGSLELSIKGAAKKKIKPGMVLIPQNNRVETARRIWLLPCFAEHINSVGGGDYHVYSSHFPVTGKEGKSGKRVDVVPLKRIVRIISDQPLFFQPGDPVTLRHFDEERGPLSMKWLAGGPLSVEQEQALDRAASSLSCSSPLKQFFAIICKVRGWVPSGGVSLKHENADVMELGAYWVENSFFKKIERFLKTRASVEGGIKEEDAAQELSVPEKLLDEFVRHRLDKGGFSIRKTFGYIVSMEAGKKAPLSPMTQKLLTDLKERGAAGVFLSQIRDSRVAEQYYNLIRMDLVIMLSDQLICRRDVYNDLSRQAVEKIRKHGPVSIAEFKNLWGISRRCCLPLLERMEQDTILARRPNNTFAAGKGGG